MLERIKTEIKMERMKFRVRVRLVNIFHIYYIALKTKMLIYLFRKIFVF